MRRHYAGFIIFMCSIIHIPLILGRVGHYGRSQQQLSERGSFEQKRDPHTAQDSTGMSVPVPGQQSQNITSTAGAGDEATNAPGMITNSPVVNDEVDCKNITTGRDNRCWAELGLTAWVNEWVDANACHTDEPFASCFLRLEGFPGLDCTGIKIDACTSPQGENLLEEPEVFYVAYNIYGEFPWTSTYAHPSG